MPVSAKKIVQIYDTLKRYLAPKTIKLLLDDLTQTEVYDSNVSFRQTIDYLLEYYERENRVR